MDKKTKDKKEVVYNFTKENAREMQLKGAKKRSELAAKRKTMRETVKLVLGKACQRGDMQSPEDIESIAALEGVNIDTQTAIIISIAQRAMLGDVQAAQFLRDTAGEKPSDKVEVDQSVTVESWAKNHKIKL